MFGKDFGTIGRAGIRGCHQPGARDPRDGDHLDRQAEFICREELGLRQHGDMRDLERLEFLDGVGTTQGG